VAGVVVAGIAVALRIVKIVDVLAKN